MAIVGGVVIGTHVALLLGCVLAFTGKLAPWIVLAGLGLKWLTDGRFLWRLVVFAGERPDFLLWPLLFVLQLVYVPVTGLLSLLVRPRWKGRRVSGRAQQ
jgi:hypothetical protein